MKDTLQKKHFKAVLTHLPLSPQPAQDGVSYKQTCLHFQLASYSEGRQTPERDAEFLPLCPVKHDHKRSNPLQILCYFYCRCYLLKDTLSQCNSKHNQKPDADTSLTLC